MASMSTVLICQPDSAIIFNIFDQESFNTVLISNDTKVLLSWGHGLANNLLVKSLKYIER